MTIWHETTKKSWQIASLIFFFLIFMSSCATPEVSTAEYVTTNSPGNTPQVQLSAIYTRESRKTPPATWPPMPTATITPTLETLPTPNFTNVPLAVFTQSAPAICPKASQTLLTLPETLSEDNQKFEKTMLEILNAGGIDQLLIRLPDYEYIDSLYFEDLTHDNVRELIISAPNIVLGNLFVFGCVNGEYKTLLSVPPAIYRPYVLVIKDTNRDRVKELVLSLQTCYYCLGMQVFEWNGSSFDSLVQDGCGYDNDVLYCSDIAAMDGYSSARIEDIDQTGTDELILEGGIPSWLGGLTGYDGPYRGRKAVYMWDGKNFSKYSEKIDPPNFRFEATQDGDNATREGNYEAALSFYQAAIFDNKLISWDEKVWKELLALNDTQYVGYPDIEKMPFNQTDYDQLSAYARYRIVLLHLKRGWEADAQIVYDTLQQKYPIGNPGHPYAEMATWLWDKYQATHDLSSACDQVVKYVQEREEILIPLGNKGMFDYRYVPESVCPFYHEQPYKN